MPFRSILFDEVEGSAGTDSREAPNFFTDLNLDQIVASITMGRDEYNLTPFFFAPLTHVETVQYRQEIFRELEDPRLLEHIGTFAQRMRAMREDLGHAEKLHYPRQQQRWFLDAVGMYCDAVVGLRRDLTPTDLRSHGFLGLREYLTTYTESAEFTSLLTDTEKLKADLAGVKYCLRIKGSRITVSRYDSEPDYGAEVLRTFEKFKQGVVREYSFDVQSGLDMNHVQAAILDLVAELHADIFATLEQYSERHRAFLDATIAAFDREVQFYIACLEHIGHFKTAGLFFCYPEVSSESKEVHGHEVFDLALAGKLIGENASIVSNDFSLDEPERIIVVSGPNQGGKTTFARMFGQLHYLASVGCPVPGKDAKLFLFDRLFTHFEREEDLQHLSGKLEDDLLRIHTIFEQATPNSILIMNEALSSTTLSDALFLNVEVMHRIIRHDMLCVCVTFLDELASLGPTTVSMVSMVDPKDPAVRTFKILRRPADGLAHAVAIAEKYRLTYASVKERIAS